MIDVYIGTTNTNRLNAKTHTKRKILQVMGFRFLTKEIREGNGNLLQVKDLDYILYPTDDGVSIVNVSDIRLVPARAGKPRIRARRPLYPDELAKQREIMERGIEESLKKELISRHSRSLGVEAA